jgi:hypothetical protein
MPAERRGVPPASPCREHGNTRMISGCVTIAMMAATSCGRSPSEPSSAPPFVSPPPGPAPPGLPITDGATIMVTSNGFDVRDVRVFQGSRLLLTSNDNAPHEILSDPFHLHSDCPEINRLGFIVPGQSRQTDPLTVARACGFHDHAHEGDPAFHGVVYIEAPQNP